MDETMNEPIQTAPFAPFDWMLSARYMRARRKEGDQFAVTAARNLFGQVVRLHAVCASAHDLHRPDGAHFDHAVLRAGAPRSPGKGSVEVGGVDEEVAAELFFGIDVRSIEHLCLSIGGSHGSCGGNGLQAV